MKLTELLSSSSPLSKSESNALMTGILTGEFTPAEIASILLYYNARNPSAHELLGFRESLIAQAAPTPHLTQAAVDLCGTGGDGKGSFNISTIAAFVVAGAGYTVIKHGNYGSNGKGGSSNLLEELGVYLPKDSSGILRSLEEVNAVFLHAPFFHPALKTLAPIRKELGVRTIFNLLGPIANPCKPSAQITGVPNSTLAALYHEVQKGREVQFVVVADKQGYDELSLTGDAELLYRDQKVTFSPQELGGALSPTTLSMPEAGAKTVALQILHNQSSAAQTKVVAANAALAISLLNKKSLQDSYEEAVAALQSGRALAVLTALQRLQ